MSAWALLSEVRDPELDEPITDLGFVAAVHVSDPSSVRVELRLPTYFCAPNFAWLMVADARDALAVEFAYVTVVLLEHFVADEINAGVAAVESFAEALGGSAADPSLEELRVTFERKAHLAAQERLARALTGAGVDPSSLVGVSFASAAAIAPGAAGAVGRRRERLGIVSELAFCDDSGGAVAGELMPGWLRFARTVRVSIEGNAGFCRGLLETRYGLARTAA